MGVEVTGGTPAMRTAVVRACEPALKALAFDETLPVQIDEMRDYPAGVEATTTPERVIVSTDLIHEGEPRLSWVLTEETAHYFLAAKTRIPHGGTFMEVLLQELFGAWLQFREHILSGRIPWSRLTTTPIPKTPAEPKDLSPTLGYDLGKHIAAAALGSVPNQRHLEAWLGDPSVNQSVKDLCQGLLELLPWQATPAEMARTLGAFYDALASGGSDG